MKVGDEITISGIGNISITNEETGKYAGAKRTVLYGTITQFLMQLTFYWDKQTGVALETQVTNGVTATAEVSETNMWKPTPFWMQWLFWAVVIVAFAVLVVTVFLLKRRSKLKRTL